MSIRQFFYNYAETKINILEILDFWDSVNYFVEQFLK